MDEVELASFLQRGPFIADQHYVGVTNTRTGFGDIMLRCNAAHCPDGVTIGADEVAAYLAEMLNALRAERLSVSTDGDAE